MNDYSHHIVADIKQIVFDDRDYKPPITFVTWAGDSHSFIVKAFDGQEYRVTVTKEE